MNFIDRFFGGTPMAFVRLLLLFMLALIMLPPVAPLAQQPKLEMHRAGVVSKDPSGWHLAVSTKGSFSVRMPIAFNDFTVHSADPKSGEGATHVIGGTSTEGIKVSVVEIPASAKSSPSLEKILANFSAKPGNKVTDVQRVTKGDVDTLSFSVSGAQTSAHIRYIKTKNATYSLTIEFPNAHRTDVAGVRDEFFDSFKTQTSER
jgi:hypothetical protein